MREVLLLYYSVVMRREDRKTQIISSFYMSQIQFGKLTEFRNA